MELTPAEASRLLQILNSHLEGMAAAKELMIEDTHTLNTLELFCEVMQNHDEDVHFVQGIKRKVQNDVAIGQCVN